MTTSYFYSYIETTSYQTTYTITLKARQSRYSLTGEWLESNDRKNWGKVTSTTGRDGRSCWYGDPDWGCRYYTGVECRPYSCTGPQSPTASQLITRLTANGRQIVSNPPIILYFRANESVVVSAGITSYTLVGSSAHCYAEYLGCTTECVREVTTCQTYPRYTQCRTECLEYRTTCYYQCVQSYTEWSRTYQLQALELVDWDTGEVYASLNQTSLTFNINANTIVRFKYVLVDSWSQSWEVILRPQPPTTPEECQRILNDPNQACKTIEWCRCASLYDPAAYDRCCKQSCLYVAVSPCCTGDTGSACLESWSGQGGQQCKIFSSGTQTLSAQWSASWSLKPGWAYHDIGKAGPGVCRRDSLVNNGASGSSRGTCSVNAEPNRGYHVNVIVIFKKTQ
jgi:hypothetical protein